MRTSIPLCLVVGLALQLGSVGAHAAEPLPETPPGVEAPPVPPAAPAPPAAEAAPTAAMPPAAEAPPPTATPSATEASPGAVTPAAAAPTAAPPAQVSAVAPSDATAAPVTAPRKLVLLPVEFVARQMSAGGVVEPVPAWTDKSQQNITQTIDSIIGADTRFQRVPLPELEPAQQARLREHIELFKVVAVDVNMVLTSGGKAWADKKINFDYTLGDGLQFLRERTGADVALIVAGGQTTQSGGNVFMQLMIAGLTGVAVGGGGTFLVCGIVNLGDGRIEWFNSLLGTEVFGMKSVDMRSAESAQRTITNLFSPYPSSPLVGRKIF